MRTAHLVLWIALLSTVIWLPAASGDQRLPIEDYAALPRFTDLEVSPGGQFVATRMTIDGSYEVVVFDISGDSFKPVYALNESEKYSTLWFEWSGSDRLLISIGFVGKRGFRGRVDTQESRLLSVALPDANPIPLYRVRRDEIPVQIQDRIVSFLPDDPDHILVQYSKADPSEPMIYKIDVTETGRHKRVLANKRSVRRWTADNKGQARVGTGIDGDGDLTLFFRKDGEKKWLNFSHRKKGADTVFYTLGFAPEPNQIYVLSNHEVQPAGLYLFDIETDSFGELIFNHPTVEIRSVGIDRDTREVYRVNFVDDDVETIWFSKREINRAISGLTKVFPDKSLSTYSVSQDAQHAVVRLSGERDAGQFLVYNNIDKRVKLFPAQYPNLNVTNIGLTIPTEYSARDGLTIPAFVTLPPGIESLEDAKDLPFVVYPHGGPAAQDFMRFNYKVQFLVSRGYGVLQMNFRGSSGYGEAFRAAGDREWGQAMQDDITDGARWLIDNGYADANRLAILGGSYGGYAALMGAVKTPDLYQCAVSFAGVADLPGLIRRERRYVDGRFSTRFIGDLWKDRKMLSQNSPAKRAEDISIPILLMHGEKDTVVDVDQSKRMAKQLDKNGKEHEFIVFENGDHYLSLYENRLRYLKETERFLERCLAPAESSALQSALH